MSEGLLRRFFENLLDDRRFRGVKRIYFHDGGETLLHPDFIGMMKTVKEYKNRFMEKGAPFPDISLLTNGTVLSEGLSKELIGLGVLDEMRFSVDGGSREKYEELRRPAKWDAISRNIRDFVRINNGRVRTGIVCIVEYDKPQNMDWMSDEFKKLCGLVDHVELRYPHDWLGQMKVEGHKKVFKDHCYFLFHSLCLLPNGDVTVCCADLNGKGVIGNLHKEGLYRIYDSERRRQMKYGLLEGRRSEIELCKDCSCG
jgi:radical SAM protein with 4Fe4S-binding SPASM domain